MSIISEKDFVDLWKAHGLVDGGLFEFDQVATRPLNTVWTVVECGNNDWIAMPGFHVVNRMGYVVTLKAWDDPTLQAYWIEAAEDDDGDLTPEQRTRLIDKLTADLVEGAPRLSSLLWDMARDGFIGFAQRSDTELLENHRSAFDEEFLQSDDEAE